MVNEKHSPWLDHLQRQRPLKKLSADTEADVTIIGAGIAGVMTAYFTLTTSSRDVTLIDAGRVAHGATGHNAGQIVSYFERQISSLAEEYGVALAAEAQRSIDSAWALLDEVYARVQPKTMVWKCLGYAGLSTEEEILVHLHNSAYAKAANITREEMMIAQEWLETHPIPIGYESFYTIAPQKVILEKLETDNPLYVAVISGRKGCINSATFTEEVVQYLLMTYPKRCRVFEDSPMREVVLGKDQARVLINDFTITAKHVVLCTNGFERFTITNPAGRNIDTKFHHLVRGAVGYMAAYVTDHHRDPASISYLPPRSTTGNAAFDSEPYFYLTRRPFSSEKGESRDLICVGGPDTPLENTDAYVHENHPYPQEAEKAIDDFLHSTYIHAPTDPIPYSHFWHGLMGYTPNGVRCVGAEPRNPILLYNLGCNGVGILPSIFGGERIAKILDGEVLPTSIFDPREDE